MINGDEDGSEPRELSADEYTGVIGVASAVMTLPAQQAATKANPKMRRRPAPAFTSVLDDNALFGTQSQVRIDCEDSASKTDAGPLTAVRRP
jgi:hypothetical protein